MGELGLLSVRQLNERIVEESYVVERVLLGIDIGVENPSLIKYNSGNICDYID